MTRSASGGRSRQSPRIGSFPPLDKIGVVWKNDRMEHDILTVTEPEPEDRAAIAASLREFNLRNAPAPNFRPLAILLKDREGNSTGGLWAETVYDWMFIELLVIPEAMRGRGVGASIMRRAEDVAIERGCVGVWLDTFSFQARGFYERLGYTVFGQLDDHPRGSTRYLLRKML
jgi:GNAT superfamily N-acetyltransferase